VLRVEIQLEVGVTTEPMTITDQPAESSELRSAGKQRGYGNCGNDSPREKQSSSPDEFAAGILRRKSLALLQKMQTSNDALRVVNRTALLWRDCHRAIVAARLCA
jgi:hypothetical protein